MNDEELRAFLESATVGGDAPEAAETTEAETAREHAAAPNAEAGSAPAQPSFDELMGLELEPLVLPEPTKRSSPAPEADLTPLLLPAPAPKSKQDASSRSDAESLPATQPLQRSEMPVPPAPVQSPVSSRDAVAGSGASAAPLTAPLSSTARASIPAAAVPAAAGAAAAASAASAAPENPSATPPAEYENIAVTGGSSKGRKAVPWIVVGGLAVLALVGSVFAVNAFRGGTEPAPTAAAPTTSEQTTTAPTTTDAITPTEPEEPDPTDQGSEVPQVEVGQTMNLRIDPWGVEAELSTKFGNTFYQIPDGVNLTLTSALIDSLPESCAAMRSQWGITQVADGQFEVLKPAERCADAPELYDELWGLTAAMVDSIKPL